MDVKKTVYRKVIMHTTFTVPEGANDSDVIEEAWELDKKYWKWGSTEETWVENE